MSFKTLVAGIARAGSFFNLISLDYPTVVDAVKDLEAQLEKAASADAGIADLEKTAAKLTARVEALEKQAMPFGGQHGLTGDFQKQILQAQAQGEAQNLRQEG